jgi:methyl-accepting chemotaxis protein
VKQTALLAHEKAAEVAATSENVARVAEFGKGSVDATITGIERMQSEMDVVAQTINRLSDQTQAVGDIIATVNDLAEQSNLLSVNASIEAAKAGDHGKGFTVVAQEVKNLAEQSKQAVAQIRNILNEIQKASQTAVQAVEQGRDAVEAGRQQSLESGKAIQQLAETASEAAQSALQISASSRQQLAGMEQISQAIENINEAGGQSASGTRQVESEIKRLQGLAVTLKLQLEADPSN